MTNKQNLQLFLCMKQNCKKTGGTFVSSNSVDTIKQFDNN